MSLQLWLKNNWIRKHSSSPQEINNLLEIVERDIRDAEFREVSPDWRFGIAYNAALKLCMALLYAEGFRPERNLAHYRTIQSMPLILGPEKEEDANYLDTCRTKRNTLEYDYAGGITHEEADELLDYVSELKKEVVNWIRKMHPGLMK